jgi:anti-sigma factor RsiW
MADRPSEYQLHAFLDGQCSSEEAARVEAFLNENPAEAARLGAYAEQKDLLRTALLDVEPEEDPALAAMGRQLERRIARRRFLPQLRAIAAGIVLFGLGAVSHAVLEPYLPWQVPPMVETATRAHEAFHASQTTELPASRRPELEARFAEHLGADIDLPDLAGLGLRLMGGRLLTSPEGAMAQLLYQDRAGGRLTVYLSGAEIPGGSGINIVKMDEYAAGYWQEGGLSYSVVAEMEFEELRQIALEIAAASGAPRL